MAPRRVTLKDIATRAGVHVATVSRTLSHHPGIPADTAERIQRIAREMEYVPDPMLSALSAYRTQLKSATFHGNLAWVTNAFTRAGWDSCETFHLYHAGAVRRAQQLGYQLEEFWLREPSMNWRRASEILAARNIRGLILPPQPRPKMRVRLDWSRFAAVTFGHTLAWPPLPTITNNTFLSMQKAVRMARALGYRRLGIVSSRPGDERVNHGWLGGFLVLQRVWPAKERIPPLEHVSARVTEKALAQWIEKYRPDAVVCPDPGVLDMLREAGHRIPEDMGYFSQSLSNHPKPIAGIDEQPEASGTIAVNIVTELIKRGEWGVPPLRQNIAVEAVWHSGRTLPRRNLHVEPAEAMQLLA